MKLCKDCKHYRHIPEHFSLFGHGRDERFLCAAPIYGLGSEVTGEGEEPCKYARAFGRQCGPDAKHWEAI